MARSLRAIGYAAGMMICAGVAQAQVVQDCEGSPLPRIMPELSDDAYVDYADGAIRLFDVYIDSHLPNGVLIGVLHPRPSELAGGEPYQACSAIYSVRDEVGYFGQVLLRQATTRYDPATGLNVTIPVRYFYRDRDQDAGTLALTINQATGVVDAVETRSD